MPHSAPISLPYEDWMAAFLSVDETMDDIDYGRKYGGMFENIVTNMGDSNCLQSFVDAINGANVLGEFVLALVYTPDDKLSDENQKRLAGVAMYPKGCLAIASQRTDWTAVEIFICCWLDEDREPYSENAHKDVLSDDTLREALEDTMTYASTVFEYQQRTHHFGVVLVGSWAWLERWDHAGVVRSSTFDYQQDPAKLARFLSRVAHASAEARGHDTTATRVLEPSADHDSLRYWAAKAEDYATDPRLAKDDYVGKLFADSLNQARAWWRIRVADDKHGVKDFLVGKPTFASQGVIGRGTRGYIALSISDPGTPLVYLKDCWRVVHGRSGLEGDILLYLNAKGVKNIPTALYHGDVADQRTVSQDLYKCAKPGCRVGVVVDNAVPTREVDEVVQDANGFRESVEGALDDSGTQLKDRAEEVARHSGDASYSGGLTEEREEYSLSTHCHYRLVVREVGLPLKEFPTGRILVWAVRDAVIAHQDAYTKAQVMHRDISVGNILIVPPHSKNKKATHQGLLADWELSKRLDDCAVEAHRPDPMGTWQFMSVHIQDHPESQVEIADELESFLHVLIYCAIRYLPHTCENVGDFMHHYFDDGVRKQETDYTCGLLKATIIKTGELITRSRIPIVFLRCPQGSADDPDPTPRNPSELSKESSQRSESPLTVSQEDMHPINGVIMTPLLQCITARYRLLYPQLRNNEGSAVKALLASCNESDDDEPSNGNEDPLGAQTKLKSQSKKIETHKYMIRLLSTASDANAHLWPGPEDRLADQLDPTFHPDKQKKIREQRAAPAAKPGPQPASKRPRSTTPIADPGEQPVSKRLRDSASRG
ncbi:hypothetical protein PYCCODRAFT_1479330 [Trametes coccinea BRFM310]|uniref:Fungal-type protein kinase domain-containing protein n=1 Tax=Trametes coccinea (strain BRFM310) TaxID=1353009 RepID=A0A1Y2IK14_TRAC3|nr:hypothetical protein PYCCODRAFT_1479330 [Trametes coccinea BRFM310]